MAEVKPEEISYPPMEQLQGFEYCIDSNPPWGEAIILGFQHYILALGTAVMIPAVLVPMMGGSDVSAAAAALLLISPNPFATTHGLRTHFSAFCCRRGTG
jgi:xanthine/uracil permease